MKVVEHWPTEHWDRAGLDEEQEATYSLPRYAARLEEQRGGVAG